MMPRCLAILLFLSPAAQAQSFEYSIRSQANLEGAPVRLPLQWPKESAMPSAVNVVVDGTATVGQLAEPSFATEAIAAQEGKVRKDVVFIVPKAEAGKPIAVSISLGEKAKSFGGGFEWKESTVGQADLVLARPDSAASGPAKVVPTLRYMHAAYDPSTPAARNKTYKVFHHLFDPAGAGKLVTNGGHTNENVVNEKDLLYPHHRGLMFGFNRCSYEGKSADTWHCTGDAHVSHQKTLFRSAGPVLGEHRVLLTWHGPKNEVFAEEQRQMSAYNVPGGTLIEFATKLTPKFDKVRLDGDPQHAGFQFRASNDVAKKTAKETYYLRPDGKGAPGETRNWDPKSKKGPVDLPWDVLSFVLDGKRYSVAYIDHPNNPGEKRYSERDYGRFGCYFEYDLTPKTPLVLNHRVWLQEGEMTAAQAQKLRDAFAEPVRASMK